MNELIDPTEMYLRTIWELQEEGITPLRARLVERLHLTAPAVSETVSRLAEEGLVTIGPNRVLGLTEEGRRLAVAVMRKHRLAERLLTDVIELEWPYVHTEACRWEHVISTRVENRLVRLLERPRACPHGNPIPGLGDGPHRSELRTLAEAAEAADLGPVILERISEHLQGNVALMLQLYEAGMAPGAKVEAQPDGDVVMVHHRGTAVPLSTGDAALVYVRPA